MSLFGLFNKQQVAEEVSPEVLFQQQAEQAANAFGNLASRPFDAGYQPDELKHLMRGRLNRMLKILDQHDVIDLNSIPTKGKGNSVVVPEPWGGHCVDVINHVFDPKHFEGYGQYEIMRDALQSMPKQVYKLRFEETLEKGETMQHTIGSLARNLIGTIAKVALSDRRNNSTRPWNAALADNKVVPISKAASNVQDVTHTEEAVPQVG